MATMNAEVYDALKSAGADDEKARRAAESVASYDKDVSDIKATLRLHSWMLAVIIAVTVVPFIKAFVSQ